ncbi:MAG: phosphate-starvation-inducible PsiE family protein [Syntrophaceae bacterium]|nr:phosphate-starvation-inducible PsiE family protein [Syntrophaceae bacterium]
MNLEPLVGRFEKIIVVSLMIMMAIVVFFGTVELGYLIIVDLLTPPMFILEVHEFLEIFGAFLLVLIGVELLETISSYQEDRTIRVEIVVIVAIIAIARKVITLDYKTLTSYTFFDVGVMVLALAISFFLLKRSRLIGKSRTGDAISRSENKDCHAVTNE